MFEQRSGREEIFKIHSGVSSLSKRPPSLRSFDTRPRRGPEDVKELERRVSLVRLLDIADFTATWMCKDEGMANNMLSITSSPPCRDLFFTPKIHRPDVSHLLLSPLIPSNKLWRCGLDDEGCGIRGGKGCRWRRE